MFLRCLRKIIKGGKGIAKDRNGDVVNGEIINGAASPLALQSPKGQVSAS